LRPDSDANENLYGHKVTAEEIIAGKVPMPSEAQQLIVDLQKSQSASSQQ
jgi:lipid-binding SYLF domain-containing protein